MILVLNRMCIPAPFLRSSFSFVKRTRFRAATSSCLSCARSRPCLPPYAIVSTRLDILASLLDLRPCVHPPGYPGRVRRRLGHGGFPDRRGGVLPVGALVVRRPPLRELDGHRAREEGLCFLLFFGRQLCRDVGSASRVRGHQVQIEARHPTPFSKAGGAPKRKACGIRCWSFPATFRKLKLFPRQKQALLHEVKSA